MDALQWLQLGAVCFLGELVAAEDCHRFAQTHDPDVVTGTVEEQIRELKANLRGIEWRFRVAALWGVAATGCWLTGWAAWLWGG